LFYPAPSLITNVYIDGFNLYYRSLKGTPFKWLDLAALCQKRLPRHQINRIRYFTARVVPRPSKPQTAQRQQVYLRALETIPNLSIHYGHYLSHPVRMPLANPPAAGPRFAEVIKTEEKGSDVNLATYLLLDAFRSDFEQAVIVSNDSDLCTPIDVVRSQFNLPVGIMCPAQNPSGALCGVATFVLRIRKGLLGVSQFPATVHDAKGTITKPATW